MVNSTSRPAPCSLRLPVPPKPLAPLSHPGQAPSVRHGNLDREPLGQCLPIISLRKRKLSVPYVISASMLSA